MRALQLFAGAGALISMATAAAPSVTPAPKIDPGRVGGVKAIIPTEPGQIGINPPADTKAIKGSIGVNTKYLTDLGKTTKWIGVNTEYITVATETYKNKAGATQTAKVTMGIGVSKNKAGGIDVLLSPKVKAKLESIAKQVKPCAAVKRRRRRGVQKRGPEACGLRDFVNRVGADEELRETFTHQITDEVWASVDEGYEGSVDGNPGFTHGEDEGYFSDEDGFFEGGSDAGSEAVVFSTEEEAVALAAEAAGVAEGSLFGGSTVTSASFLVLLWGAFEGGKKALDAVYQVPSESIHKITKTKTASKTHAPTSSSSTNSCPSATALPKCDAGCLPKLTMKKANDKAKTDVPYWSCTKGKTQNCECVPGWSEVVHPYNADVQNVLAAIFKEAGKLPAAGDGSGKGSDPKCDLHKLSTLPYNLFGAIAQTTSNVYSDFCKAVKKDNLKWTVDSGGKNTDGGNKRSIERRTPPLDPSMYKDVRLELEYKKPESGSCTPDCNKAFESLGSKCHSEGGMNKPMATGGSVDSGCGVFSFKVYDGPIKGQCKKEGDDKVDTGKLKKAGMALQDSVDDFCKDFNPRTPLFLATDENGKKTKDGIMSLRFSPKNRGQVANDCDCLNIFRDVTGCIGQGDKNVGEIDNNCGTFTAKYGKGLSGSSETGRKCYGIDDKKYLLRDTLAAVIKNDFCPTAVAQKSPDKDSASIFRKYFESTRGAVSITIDFQPGTSFQPTQDECVQRLLGNCLDDCGYDNNPLNLKGGGEYITFKDGNRIRYAVTPLKERPDPRPTSTSCTYKDGGGFDTPCDKISLVIGNGDFLNPHREKVHIASYDFDTIDKTFDCGHRGDYQKIDVPLPLGLEIHPGNACKDWPGEGGRFDNTWVNYGSLKQLNTPTSEYCKTWGKSNRSMRCVLPINP